MREESERERIREALRARKFSGIAKSIEILKYRLFRAYPKNIKTKIPIVKRDENGCRKRLSDT